MLIPQEEYRARRLQLTTTIEPGSIAIIPAAKQKMRNGDCEYAFRQNSDFHYLTGFPHAEAIAVLKPGRAEGEFILFNQPKDAAAETWTGIRPGQIGAKEQYGADESHPIAEFATELQTLLLGCSHVYYAFGRDTELDDLVTKALNTIRDNARSGIEAPFELINIETILHEMRLRKSDNEIAVMRKAAEISANAHTSAMKACKPGMHEYELQAEIEYACAREGATQQAYTPIVAGGKNACILHYIDNNMKLPDDGLVLIDAGGEYQQYASDITRTFPVNGKFNHEQRAIYNIVLKAQLAVISLIAPGTSRQKLEATALTVLTEGLVELDILRGDVKKLIEEKAYFPFYMHRIGHWLGLDVHDVGKHKIGGAWRALEPGMVLTVEPGIYISPDNQDVDARWRGIGVRIEDDILVTEEGRDILSKAAPKEIDDIEALMA